jgi:hypothetical protein
MDGSLTKCTGEKLQSQVSSGDQSLLAEQWAAGLANQSVSIAIAAKQPDWELVGTLRA